MTTTAPGRDLADQLERTGKLTTPEWRQAITDTPRQHFIPHYYRQTDDFGWETIDTVSGEGLKAVYANTVLITALGRTGTNATVLSSSTQPGLMTRMLDALDVHDGHKVLEIGTGTGYNAALLSHRLGDEHVYSIDLEPDLVDTARQRLAELGHHPTLLAGDGWHGLPEHAPFDRIIATCAVPRIPWGWIEQTTVRRGRSRRSQARTRRRQPHPAHPHRHRQRRRPLRRDLRRVHGPPPPSRRRRWKPPR